MIDKGAEHEGTTLQKLYVYCLDYDKNSKLYLDLHMIENPNDYYSDLVEETLEYYIYEDNSSGEVNMLFASTCFNEPDVLTVKALIETELAPQFFADYTFYGEEDYTFAQTLKDRALPSRLYAYESDNRDGSMLYLAMHYIDDPEQREYAPIYEAIDYSIFRKEVDGEIVYLGGGQCFDDTDIQAVRHIIEVHLNSTEFKGFSFFGEENYGYVEELRKSIVEDEGFFKGFAGLFSKRS